MKFRTDDFGDRELEYSDRDRDRLRVTLSAGTDPLIICNHEAVRLSRRKLRKLARAILKETEK